MWKIVRIGNPSRRECRVERRLDLLDRRRSFPREQCPCPRSTAWLERDQDLVTSRSMPRAWVAVPVAAPWTVWPFRSSIT
jgi:hypothetical protein